MKTSFQIRRVLLALSALALWSCGGGSSSKSSSSSPPPPPPPAPTTGSVQLTNATSSTIGEVYVSPTSSPTWGPIQNGAPIAPAAVWTLNGVPPDSYDGMAVVVGTVSRYYAYEWNFPVTAGATYATTVYSSAFTGSLRVVNGATSSVTALYVAAPGAPGWGGNQLSASIPLSGTFVLSDIDPGAWDVMCVHDDTTTNTAHAVAIASLSNTTVNCP